MKIEILYPEVCNLYGDLQNIEYLKRSLVTSGETVEIIETSLKSEPYFNKNEDFSLVYMGTLTEKSQELCLKALTPYKARIEELIGKNKIFLFTGNSLEILGDYIECDDGSKIPCMGIFKTHAVRRMLSRYNSLYVGKFDDIDIVGFKSQFTFSYGEYSPLFHTVRGDGMNRETGEEGIRVNNFFGTYIIGPLLILNPPFTKYFMKLMGAKEPVLAYEEAAMDVFEHRLSEFMDPKRGLTY